MTNSGDADTPELGRKKDLAINSTTAKIFKNILNI